MQNFNIKYHIYQILFCGIFILLTTGCSDENIPTPSSPNSESEEKEVIHVPITISLGGYSYENTTRSAPPGAGTTTPAGDNSSEDNGYEETKSINTVRIITFKRKAESDGFTSTSTVSNKADDEDFVYDAQNDLTLTELTDETGHQDDYFGGASHKHRVAKGTFAKSYGYEYRIVALAYDSEETVPYPLHTQFKVIDNYTNLNIGEGKTFKDFCATFARDTTTLTDSKVSTNWETYIKGGGAVSHNSKNLSRNLVSIPQLFYGQCYLKGDDTQNPIISYYSVDADNNAIATKPIVGTLYRGMAEVVVNIKTAGELTANPQWYCLLADNVLTGVKLTQYDDFNHGYNTVKKDYYTAFAYHSTPNKGEVITLRGYLLPGKTHLGVRVSFHLDPYARNGMLTTSDVSSADNATGVISVDVANNIFYLRRNHKYVFTCDDQNHLLRKHEIE